MTGDSSANSTAAQTNTAPDILPRWSWAKGINRYHALVFLGCWLGGIFDGMDSTLMSVAGPKAITELLGTTDPTAVSHVASIVGAVFLLGWTVGGLIFGVMGDRLGRVR